MKDNVKVGINFRLLSPESVGGAREEGCGLPRYPQIEPVVSLNLHKIVLAVRAAVMGRSEQQLLLGEFNSFLICQITKYRVLADLYWNLICIPLIPQHHKVGSEAATALLSCLTLLRFNLSYQREKQF